LAKQPYFRLGNQISEDPESQKASTEKTVIKPYVPTLPFPQRQKPKDTNKQFIQVLNMFKKLYIYFPFAEALAQMPTYAKFMKDILRNKRKLEDHETMMLNEECHATLQINYLLSLRIQGASLYLAP